MLNQYRVKQMKEELEIETVSELKKDKTKKLLFGLLFDAIGMLSFTIPFVGEFSDVVWAPIAGFLMTTMYRGRVGKIAGFLTFVEEIIPFTDMIPSFTLTWMYTYWIKNKNAQ